MTGPLIHHRALRPDGTEAARGPLRQDVIADAESEAGQPWWLLELAGWRIEPVPDATKRETP